MITNFPNPEIQAVFDGYPAREKAALLAIRELIFAVAANTAGVGVITETLKWAQPSYLTLATGAGTTVRLDCFGSTQVAVFFHCQTTLVGTFRILFPELSYSKNRAIVLNPQAALPMDELSVCIEMALTYHLNKAKAKAVD